MYSLTLLDCHTLSTTNIGIEAGLAVNLNFFMLGVFLFNNVLKCYMKCEIL
jgi:hypothetical protein